MINPAETDESPDNPASSSPTPPATNSERQRVLRCSRCTDIATGVFLLHPNHNPSPTLPRHGDHGTDCTGHRLCRMGYPLWFPRSRQCLLGSQRHLGLLVHHLLNPRDFPHLQDDLVHLSPVTDIETFRLHLLRIQRLCHGSPDPVRSMGSRHDIHWGAHDC